MEDKKVLTTYRAGVLCMILYAYPDNLLWDNRDISGERDWLIDQPINTS